MLRRLLLILVFAVGLTGHSLVAEHSADASVPRHVATRSERVASNALLICRARKVELHCITPFEENHNYLPRDMTWEATTRVLHLSLTTQSFTSRLLIDDR